MNEIEKLQEKINDFHASFIKFFNNENFDCPVEKEIIYNSLRRIKQNLYDAESLMKNQKKEEALKNYKLKNLK